MSQELQMQTIPGNIKRVVTVIKRITKNGTDKTTAHRFRWESPSDGRLRYYFYDPQRGKIQHMGTPLQPLRNFRQYKARQPPVAFTPVWNEQTGQAFSETGPGGVFRRSVHRSSMEAQMANLGDERKTFFDSIKGTANRTYGEYQWTSDGKWKRIRGKKSIPKMVKLRFRTPQGINEYKTISIKTFKRFSIGIDKALGAEGYEQSGSDYIQVAGGELATDWFELDTISGNYGDKNHPKYKGAGGTQNWPQHKIYKRLDCNAKDNGNGFCAIRCLKTALKIKGQAKKIAADAGIISDSCIFSSTGEGDDLQKLEIFYDCGITVLDLASPGRSVLREATRVGPRQVELFFATAEDVGHFLLVQEPHKRINQKKKIKKTPVIKKLLYLDYESVHDNHSMQALHCYSAAWFVSDYTVVSPIKRDNESPRLWWMRCAAFILKLRERAHYVDTSDVTNPATHVIEWIRNNSTTKVGGVFHRIHYTICGFNSSRFDNYFTCQSAAAYGDGALADVLYVQNLILNFRLRGGHDSLDLSRFLPGTSLKNACGDFKTVPQKNDLGGFSHASIQKVFEAGGWSGLNAFLSENRQTIRDYNVDDVLCLADLTAKLRKSFCDMGKDCLVDKMTIGRLAYEDWKKNCPVEVKAPETFSDEKQIRSSLTAGRTQCFLGKQKIEMPLAMADVKSEYPWAMMNNDFPIGEYKKVKAIEAEEVLKTDKLGIFSVQIVHQRIQRGITYTADGKKITQVGDVDQKCWDDFLTKLSPEGRARLTPEQVKYSPTVFPKRSSVEGVALNWEHRGRQRCKMSSIDIKCLRSAAGFDSVYVIDEWREEEGDCCAGVYWEEKSRIVFTDYLKPFMDEKNLQDAYRAAGDPRYNPAKRECCKLALNCISGRVIKKVYDDFYGLLKGPNEIQNFISNTKEDTRELNIFGPGLAFGKGKLLDDKQYDSKKAAPCQLGIFIYSYARRLMFGLLSRYASLYMDTDSVLLPRTEYLRLREEQPTFFPELDGNRKMVFGDLEEEAINMRACGVTDIRDVKDSDGPNLAITTAPKCYTVVNKAEEANPKLPKTCNAKRRFKGVRSNNTWQPIEDYPIIQRAYNERKKRAEGGDHTRYEIPEKAFNAAKADVNIREKLNTARKTNSLEMFEKLYNAKPGEKAILVYCSLLEKSISRTKSHVSGPLTKEDSETSEAFENAQCASMQGTEFSIRQRWMIKAI